MLGASRGLCYFFVKIDHHAKRDAGARNLVSFVAFLHLEDIAGVARVECSVDREHFFVAIGRTQLQTAETEF